MAALLRTWTGREVATAAAEVLPWLLRQEGVNNLLVGLLSAAQAGREQGLDLAAVRGPGGTTLAVGLRSTVKYALSPAEDPGAVRLLAQDALRRHPDLPGWVGPAAEADAFADVWAAAGRPPRLGRRLRIYELEAVRPGPRAPGELLPAGREHRDRLIAWSEAFAAEIGEPLRREAAASVDEDLALGTAFVWREPGGALVALAACGGATPNGIRIRKVFTPPERRRRGYASAAVAALSARLLAGGRRFCFLYADEANPTANAIYQAIGYRAVCAVRDYALP